MTGLMPLILAVGSVATVVALVAVAVQRGLRDGDRGDDVTFLVSVTAEAGCPVAWIEATNPHRSPVVVSARARPASRLRARLGSPLTVRTTRSARGMPRRSAIPPGEVLGTVRGRGAAGWALPLHWREQPRAVRVEVTAYQRRGRVRVATHLVRVLSASRSAVPSHGSW